MTLCDHLLIDRVRVIRFGGYYGGIEVGEDASILVKLEAFNPDNRILASNKFNEAASGSDGESLLLLAIRIILLGLHLGTVVAICANLIPQNFLIELEKNSTGITITDVDDTGTESSSFE